MRERCVVTSPLGNLLLEADECGLTRLSFVSDDLLLTPRDAIQVTTLKAAVQWLERYFNGEKVAPFTNLHLQGTPFQLQVWHILCDIPYGATVTYGDIARILCRSRDGQPVAAQAVGGAVGKNPIAIIVPCHRVIGANGRLIGYTAGLDKKIALLKQEGMTMKNKDCL